MERKNFSSRTWAFLWIYMNKSREKTYYQLGTECGAVLPVCSSLREKLKENTQSVQWPLCFEYKANMCFLKQIQQIAVICFLYISAFLRSYHIYNVCVSILTERGAQFSFGKLTRRISVLFFSLSSRPSKVKLSWSDILLLREIARRMRMKKVEIPRAKTAWEETRLISLVK